MNDDVIVRPPQEEEVFLRVWQRVMGDRTPQTSPIETTHNAPQTRRWVDGDMSCDYLAALANTMPARAVPQDSPASDLPAMLDTMSQSEHTARLRQQTLEALEAWQFYRHLARRTRGNAARTLTNLAADQHQLARKLATAYFLHSGVRYWPSEQLPTPTISSYWGALRQRHQWEQQAELSYRMAADETEDATLTELYEGLTQSCRSHCRQLRMLLEQSCP